MLFVPGTMRYIPRLWTFDLYIGCFVPGPQGFVHLQIPTNGAVDFGIEVFGTIKYLRLALREGRDFENAARETCVHHGGDVAYQDVAHAGSGIPNDVLRESIRIVAIW